MGFILVKYGQRLLLVLVIPVNFVFPAIFIYQERA